jgi:hypothetical protein
MEETDRPTDRQTDREIDRQAGRETVALTVKGEIVERNVELKDVFSHLLSLDIN